MPRKVDPGNIRVGKGTAPEGTVEDNSFRYPERDVDPLRVHIHDPSRAHMAEAIGIVDEKDCFESDNVEGALGELCSGGSAGRLNGLVAGGTFVESFPHAGLTLTLVDGTEIMLGRLVLDASGFTITVPDAAVDYYVYFDADPASPTHRTLQATTGAPPEIESATGVEHVMIAKVTCNGAGSLTTYQDARFFVRNLDRKVQYSSRQGENVDAWSEGCFATLEAAMFWMEFYGDTGTSEDEKGTLIIRGTHTLSSTLTIPADHLRFVGDGEAIIEAGVGVSTRLVLIDTTTTGRADIEFQGITFQTSVASLTCIEVSGANDISDLRIEGCRFTDSGASVFDTCVALATPTSGVLLRDNTFVAEVGVIDATSGLQNARMVVANNHFFAGSATSGSAAAVDFPTEASLLNNVVVASGAVSWDSGFLLSQAVDTRVVGNTFSGCVRGLVLRDGGSGISVLDNVFTGGGVGVQLDQEDLSISPVASEVSIHLNTFKNLEGPAVSCLSSLDAILDIASYGGLTAGDVVLVNGFPLTGVTGPRTSGANDFQVDAGGASAVASDIATAINDAANQFAARGITASSSIGSTEVSFTTPNPYAGAVALGVVVTTPGAITVSNHGLAIQDVSVVENDILDVCGEINPTFNRSALEVVSHNSNTGRADNLKISDNTVLAHAATQAPAIGVYVWNTDLRDSVFSGNTINGVDGGPSPGGGIHTVCRSSDFTLRTAERIHADRNSMWVSGDVGVATATLTVTGAVANGETVTLGGAVLTASASQTNGGDDFDEGAGSDALVAASIVDAINASLNATSGIVRAEIDGATPEQVNVFAGSRFPGSLGRLVQVSTTAGNITIGGATTSLNGNEYLTPPDWSAAQTPGHRATFRLLMFQQPASSDTIGFNYPDGSSETWEWGGAGPTPYPVTIGATVEDSAANFVAAVNANSTQVQAYLDPRDPGGLNIIIEARDEAGAWPGVVGNRIQVDGVLAARTPFDPSEVFILGSTDGYFSFGEDFGLHGVYQEVDGQVSLLTTAGNTVQIQSVLTSGFHRPHYLRTVNPNGSYISGGAFATGSLTFTSGVVDGDTFTIDDGLGTTITFEFDDNGSVTPGNDAIPISGLTTATEFRDAALGVIQKNVAYGSLRTLASAGPGSGEITLTSAFPGAAFNGDGPSTSSGPQVVAVAYAGGVDGAVSVVNRGSRNVQITSNQFYGGIGSRVECFDGMLLRDLMWSNNQSRGLDPSGGSAFLWNNDPNREYGFSLILRSTYPAPFSTENVIPVRSVNISGNQFTDLPGGAVGIHHNEFRSMLAGVYTGIVINDNNVGNCGSNGQNPEVISVTMYGSIDLPTLYGSDVSNNTIESSVATRIGNRRPSQVEALGLQLSPDTGLCEAALIRVDSFVAAQGVSVTGNRIIDGRVTATGIGEDLHVSCHGVVLNPGVSVTLAQTSQNLVVSDNHVYGLDLVAGNDGDDANAVWVSHLAIMEPGLVTLSAVPLVLLEGSHLDGNNVTEPLAADPGTSSTTLVTDRNGILAGILINVGTLSKVSTSNNRVSNSRKDLGGVDPTGPLNFDNAITGLDDPAMGGIVILSSVVDMVTVDGNIIRNRGQGGVTQQKPQMGVLVYTGALSNSTMSHNDIRLEDTEAASRSRCVLLHTVLTTTSFSFSGNTMWNGAYPITSFPPPYTNDDGKGLQVIGSTVALTQVVGNSAFTAGPCFIFVDTATGGNVFVDGLTFANNTGSLGNDNNINYGAGAFVLGPGTLNSGTFTGNVLTAFPAARYGFDFGSTTLDAQTLTGNIVTSPAGAVSGGAPAAPSPRGTCVANQYTDTSGGGTGTGWTAWANPGTLLAVAASNDT